MSELLDTSLNAFPISELASYQHAEYIEAEEDEEQRIVVPLTSEQAALVAENVGVVDYVLREALSLGKLGPYSHLHDDFAGYLQLELCRTATRYDQDGGASFSTYAINRLRYEVLDIVRNLSSLDGRPRSAVQHYKEQVRQAEADGLFLQPETSLVTNMSLSELMGSGEDSLTLLSVLPDPAPTPEEVIASDSSVDNIAQLIGELPIKMRAVVEEYIAGSTLDEIGERRGLTESRACQIFTAARQHLLRDLDLVEPAYDDQTLADKVMSDLLRSKLGTFSARPGADVAQRLANQTGVSAEQVKKIIERLHEEGFIQIDYAPRTVNIISKLSLTVRGSLLEVLPEPGVNADIKDFAVPEQRLDLEEPTADDVLATLSRQLLTSNPS